MFLEKKKKREREREREIENKAEDLLPEIGIMNYYFIIIFTVSNVNSTLS